MDTKEKEKSGKSLIKLLKRGVERESSIAKNDWLSSRWLPKILEWKKLFPKIKIGYLEETKSYINNFSILLCYYIK